MKRTIKLKSGLIFQNGKLMVLVFFCFFTRCSNAWASQCPRAFQISKQKYSKYSTQIVITDAGHHFAASMLPESAPNASSVPSTIQGGVNAGVGAAAVTGATGGTGGGSVCPSCGSMDIDVDRSRGNAVCTGCGQVLEQNMIVNDTEFIATGVGDSKRAIGQFVGQ